MSGRLRGTAGRWLAGYGWVALLVVAAGCVNVLSAAQHGAAGWAALRGPVLDETSSALVIICLLPIIKHSVDRLAATPDRRIALIVIALAMMVYALLHITFMVALRHLAYGLLGIPYDPHLRDQFVTEFRKDLVSAFMLALVFWLVDRKAAVPGPIPAHGVPDARRPEIWLRDGAKSIRVDPAQIVSVTSAGNYVEFALADARHLIRGTLAGEESRLKPFGFVRIHRTRLVNVTRVVAIEPRTNGDFVAKMDSGEMIAGSRRYRDAVAAIKGTSN
ncbi:MAG TPA: LytTR family transcriptional regulator DNA-binding domain-containing protein [Bradyrhizobium sp.]|nr:LytTR family transcriptional regulator DNA-binding domain-containing protein [Bradyrhizobium sp.]